MNEVKFAFRQLLRNPGFTTVAVLTLALGIGANTAIFSVVDQLLDRPLPVPNPGQLALVARPRQDGSPTFSFNYPFFADLRDHSKSFRYLVATAERAVGFSTGESTERVSALFVSGDYFRMLEIDATLGRTFMDREGMTIGDGPVVVISHGLWQRRFGADPRVIGRTASVNGRPFTIIGVTPREFTGTERGSRPDVYLPITLYAELNARMIDGQDPLTSRFVLFHETMGRLRDGISLNAAQIELRTLAAAIRAEHPNPDDQIETNLLVLPGARGMTGDLSEARLPLNLLLATAGFVLLIACANLANLQLARALNRSREFAIRLALGARRHRVIRGLLIESLMLAMLGGVMGVLLAWWLTPLLEVFRPPDSNFELVRELDFRMLAFAVAVSVLTGLLFGLAPAWRSSRAEVVPELKGASRDIIRHSHWSLQNLLVATQVALAVVVLAAAGLCVRSLGKLAAIAREFTPSQIVLLSLDPALSNYSQSRARGFFDELLQRARNLPGVESASLARSTPLSGKNMRMSVEHIEGYEMRPDEFALADVNIVAPGYFRTLKIPILQGRDFGNDDARPGVKTVIVNDAFAKRYWPAGDALGKHLHQTGFDGSETVMEVVGIVRGSSQQKVQDPEFPMMFRPLAQWNERTLTLVARSGIDPSTTIANLRGLVRSIDATLPVFNSRTLAQQRDGSLAMQRMAATLLSGFGMLALFLAALGLYGVLAYIVGRRTREIGVRMALGADAGKVIRLVLRQGLNISFAGTLAGILGAIGLTRVMRGFLFGVSPLDPIAFGCVLLLLMVVTAISCWLPARRAARVDPTEALRNE